MISSRFNGPSILKTPDGRYEHVLPEPTVTEVELQAALIASQLRVTVFPRRRLLDVILPRREAL